MGEKIELTNVGPIEGDFSIELNGPGLYELRGNKGTGKTTILESLSLIAGHKSYLTVHDGELRGSVEGFGVTAPIGSRKKRQGELEVTALDSEKFDLVDLIDPQGKTPPVRDNVRIKALATMKGVKLGPQDFSEILSKEEIEHLGVELTDDPVLYCNRIKRVLDSDAKRVETQVTTSRNKAEQLRENIAGLDLDQEADTKVLSAEVEAAIAQRESLRSQREAAEEDARRRSTALVRLASTREDYTVPSESIRQEREALQGDIDAMQERIVALQEEMSKEVDACNEALLAASKLDGRIDKTMQQEKAIESLEEVLADPVLVPPAEEQVENAETALAEARAAQEEGVRIRDALKARDQAEALDEDAAEMERIAANKRAAGKRIFDVLTAKLQTQEIMVQDVDGSARLIVKHPARGKTFFDHIDGLSDGERVQYAIYELLPHLQSPGLFPVPQRTYQDLPPADRKELAKVAEEKGLYVFGAQVSDGDLRVEKIENE